MAQVSKWRELFRRFAVASYLVTILVRAETYVIDRVLAGFDKARVTKGQALSTPGSRSSPVREPFSD